MQTTFKQLRRETGAVVRAVERGEIVIITYRGRPVAEMSTVGHDAGTGDDQLFGIWRDNKAVSSVENYLAKVRKGRVG
jgi:antitoxin (DNA-binding transcriptional repressor) of toxin-antitoxin stability system